MDSIPDLALEGLNSCAATPEARPLEPVSVTKTQHDQNKNPKKPEPAALEVQSPSHCPPGKPCSFHFKSLPFGLTEDLLSLIKEHKRGSFASSQMCSLY